MVRFSLGSYLVPHHHTYKANLIFNPCSMADVTYNTSSFPALVGTISRVLSLSNTASSEVSILDPDQPPRDPPMIVLAYKQRDPAEHLLWDMLEEKTGVKLTKVGIDVGAGSEEEAVEIWIGQA